MPGIYLLFKEQDYVTKPHCYNFALLNSYICYNITVIRLRNTKGSERVK